MPLLGKAFLCRMPSRASCAVHTTAIHSQMLHSLTATPSMNTPCFKAAASHKHNTCFL